MAAGSASVSFADHPEEEDEYGEEAAEGDEGADADADGDDDESRPLTHEEMWDDSALVDAWNSAEAEYEVLFLSCPFLTRARRSCPILQGLPRHVESLENRTRKKVPAVRPYSSSPSRSTNG